MYATTEGTTRYIEPLPGVPRRRVSTAPSAACRFRAWASARIWAPPTTPPTQSYTDALIAAGAGGINFFDTAINYRSQRSERCDRRSAAPVAARRDRGLHQGRLSHPRRRPRVPDAGSTSWARCIPWLPIFWPTRSIAAAPIWAWTPSTSSTCTIPKRSSAFSPARSSTSASAAPSPAWSNWWRGQKIRWYGAATWDGFRKKARSSLPRLVGTRRRRPAARNITFASSSFPSTWGWWRHIVGPARRACCRRRRAWASRWSPAPRSRRARRSQHMPEALAATAARLSTNAQRAIQFTRSTPGIAVALVGMSRREHVRRKSRRGAGRARHARTVSAPLPVMTTIDVGEDLAQLDAAIEALPDQPAVFLLWPREGEPYLSRTGVLRRRLRAPAHRTRAALAIAQPAAHRGAHRIPPDRLGIRIFHRASTNRRAAIFPDTYLQPDEAAHAAVREARAQQRISAQPHHHAPDAHRRPLLRTVPLARLRGALRGAVPRSVPDAPLPGGPGAFARAPRLHLRRDGDVPAALPAGGGRRRSTPRGRARGRSSCAPTGARCWNPSGTRATG